MIVPETIGLWHNRSLRNLALTKFRRMMKDISDFLVHEGQITQLEADATQQAIIGSGLDEWLVLHPQLLKGYPRDSEETAFLAAAAASLGTYLTPHYSSDFIMAWRTLITRIPSVTTFDGFVQQAEQVFSYGATGNEAAVVQVALSVIRRAKEHWSGQGAPKIKPGTWVIVNDGIGGVLGILFRGVGSIIVGTAASAWTNEELDSLG